MNTAIADLRRDYAVESLLESDVETDPIDQFTRWWDQAIKARIDEVNAMVVSTASADGMPAARVMLLKDYNKDGFVFFTNYKSYKGMHLEENPKACLVFFWKELERQVRITGLVSKIPGEQSDQYYLSRPKGSQLGAWASPQSTVIPGREWLDQHYKEVSESFNEKELSRPPHWGGFLVKPVIIEFWQGRASRLHDRIQYTLENDGWKIERLAP
ncbi:MAG: pyridoxamine 5'-phosphate oxidase [Flavisolibacter sp.]